MGIFGLVFWTSAICFFAYLALSLLVEAGFGALSSAFFSLQAFMLLFGALFLNAVLIKME